MLFGWVWVGLGHGPINSLDSGLGWVGSVIWWVGLGWVDENRPTDNSALMASVTCGLTTKDRDQPWKPMLVSSMGLYLYVDKRGSK